MYSYVGTVARDRGCTLLAAGGMPDHAHLLIALSRTTDCAGIMAAVKANSSRRAKEAGAAGFAWHAGYAAFGVGWDGLDRVRGYIADQERHHAGQSFQDELRRMLTVHGQSWDERYVWD